MLYRALGITLLALITSSSASSIDQAEYKAQQEVFSNAQSPKSIAIVGAGSAGLAILKTLLDLPYEVRQGWDIVLYEQRRQVGGVWLPDLNDVHPPYLPETPLYPDLRTNTPHPTMTYPHFPFRPMSPMFPTWDYVEQYHADFTNHFNLYPYIHLNTTVESASWVGNSTDGKWNISVQEQQTGRRSYALFDHFIVASGHNHYPYIPTWEGQEDWLREKTRNGQQREILHSIFWRNATKYEKRTVLVVGGNASGRDVALHVAPVAEKLYLSLKGNGSPRRLPVGYIVKPEISHFTSTHVYFVDGSSVSDVDSIVLGTGYEMRIPFLTQGGALAVDPSAESCPLDPPKLTTNLRYVFPLHEHVFSLAGSYPTTALAFVGLPILVANCPSDVAQSLFIAHAIANPGLLPTRDEMLAQLRQKESHMITKGFDPYRVGHRLIDVDDTQRPDGRPPDMGHDYQDDLVQYLKEKGALPNDGKPFVEDWRRIVRNDSEYLYNAWQRVEGLGEEAVRHWLKGARTEDDWVDVMHRLIEWEKRQDIRA